MAQDKSTHLCLLIPCKNTHHYLLFLIFLTVEIDLKIFTSICTIKDQELIKVKITSFQTGLSSLSIFFVFFFSSVNTNKAL